MSGPSGAGKTACLRMLCQELGVEILEWKEESRVLNAGDECKFLSLSHLRFRNCVADDFQRVWG